MATPIPSTAPDAKAALLAALRAQEGLEGVQVSWGHPGKHIRDECVYFGDTELDERAAQLGNRRRRESYTLEVVLTVERRGDDSEATERRAWVLLAEIAGVLREDADLGGAVTIAEQTASPVRNFIGEGKRVSEAVVRVRVEADT